MLDCATQTFYSIEAPGVLRSNAVYSVAINLFDAAKTCDVKISLSGGDFNVDKVIKVHPWSTRMLSFEIPTLTAEENYYLEAECLKSNLPKKRTQLLFEKCGTLAYIQCDKQAYNRGDKVDFRVIVLEPNFLKPSYKTEPLNIVVKHSKEVVLQKSNVELHKGVYTSQWYIPSDAYYGLYNIEVSLNNELIKKKNFEVIDYRQPKFDIKINTEKNVLYTQKQLFIGLEANYLDGSPLDGMCKLEVETVGGFFSGVYLEKIIPIKGNIEYTIIDFVDDLKIDKTFEDMEYFTEASIMIKANITDAKSKEDETLTELVLMKKYEKEIEKMLADKNAEHSLTQSDENCQENGEISVDAIKIMGPKNGSKAGDILDFTFKLNKPTNYFAYVVTARGSIIESDFLKVCDFQQPVNLKLESDFQYVPRAYIMASFVYNGVFYFDEIHFDLAEEFVANLKITLPQCAEPGLLLPIEIETSPNSLVALMAVDSKTILLNSENDLNYHEFFRDLRKLRSRDVYLKGRGRYPGLASGLVTLSNAIFDGLEIVYDEQKDDFLFFDAEYFEIMEDKCQIDVNKFEKNVIRLKQEHEHVYGNWFFVDKESDENGLLKFETQLPDNPTTWLISAFAINNIKGFTMPKEPIEIVALAQKPAISYSISSLKNQKIQTKVIDIIFESYHDEKKQVNYTLELLPNGKPLEITFNITESLFGPAIAHLNDHAGIMYETGHLHMTTVIPNINVLEYLDYLNQLDSELALSIKQRFPEAIERELADRRDKDGSFSWFGNDPTGSPYMTSVVLQAFQRAAKYVQVDPDVIRRGLNYLVSQQMPTGEIVKEQNPYMHTFQENSDVGLTSMVLLAFLLNEQVKAAYADFINKSFDYIISNIEAVEFVYDLALAFYAMQLARHPYAATLKTRIFEIAKMDSNKNHKWWTNFLDNEPNQEGWLPVNDLEITSYILLALLETESIETLLPIIKWMLPKNEFPNEGMDRAVASDAILKMAIKCGAALGVMEVDYKAFTNDEVYSGKIMLTPENSAKVLMHVLPLNTTQVEISSKHNGTFFGNITCRYVQF